ncbi:MAG: GerMN domain-containing protein [Candidatus Komeilibacteria bacterium]
MKKLIWLLIIAGGIYYGYNNWLPATNNDITDENTNIEQPETSNEWLTYKNTSYANYSIQYPADWNVETGEESTKFLSPDNLDDVVVSLQNKHRSGTQTIKEIAGSQVIIIEGEDPDDGSPTKFIAFNLSNEEKLEVRGFGSIFDRMIETLVINSEQPVMDKETVETEDEVTEEVPAEETEQVEEEVIEQTEEEIVEDTPIDENEEFIIKIFYQKDSGDNCSAVEGVVKDIDTRYNTDEVNALVTLTQGLTSEEIALGYTTSIPFGTRLRNLTIQSGVATVDFNSVLNEGGGSCMMAARRAQIVETLMQFPDIEQVIISVDGNVEEALQP